MVHKSTKISASMSPLRYPGAKRWMVGYIGRAIICNELAVDLFVEPFAGGASVAISLLTNNIVEKIGINELDPLVSALWSTLFFDTDWLVGKIKNAQVSLNEWDRIKKSRPRTTRGKAYKCLFLNRTNFSGILKNNAGPIGGRNQSSDYKINCRFNKSTLIKRINKIAKHRDRVAFVWNLDWKDAIDSVERMQAEGELPSSALFYIDPPFFKKGKSLYPYYFKHEDHLRLNEFLDEFSQPWILSYDMCPEIIKMYLDSGLSACDVNLIYTTRNFGKRQLGKEVIFSNLPNMISELQLGADKIAGSTRKLDNTDITLKNHFDNASICDNIGVG